MDSSVTQPPPYYHDDWLTVYLGDCREVLTRLPAESVNTVVTSPPYWGLRDYGTATWDGGDPECDHMSPAGGTRNGGRNRAASGGTFHDSPHVEPALATPYRDRCGKCGAIRQDSQIGLEQTPEEYVATLVGVFREVKRVLRDDGTLWLNLGDSYASNGPGSWGSSDKSTLATGSRNGAWAPGNTVGHTPSRQSGLKPKDLVGIPWRVAFALQADGWYLRSDIIWSKPNPMPESVTDRPTKSHEYVFLLSKSPRYHFDADAVAEGLTESSIERLSQPTLPLQHGSDRVPGKTNGPMKAVGTAGGTRNIRSVWTIATQPYPGAHFATFPPKLVEPCILAGCPERVCAECGAAWERVVERIGGQRYATGKSAAKNGAGLATAFSGYTDGSSAPTFITTGWRPSCKHYPRTDEWREVPDRHEDEPDKDYEDRITPVRSLRASLLAVWEPMPTAPGVALDPFAGTGTVGMVAQQLSRRAVLIDLNGEYLDQLRERNAQTPLGLTA